MKVHIPSDIRPAADSCIYCGAREQLSLEHIIPFGLWGRIEFPNASCAECAKRINVFETQVQQKHLAAFRTRTKIPLRKRRPRKYKFQLSFGSKQGGPPAPDPVEIGGDEVPANMLLLRFTPPKIFVDGWPKDPTPWMFNRTSDWRELSNKHQQKATAIFMGEYDNNMFCRLIAKIGHGLTIAYMPRDILGSFEFLLLDLIRFGTVDMHYLVGGDYTVPPATINMHDWQVCNAVRGETEYLFARIRLFACLGTPVYHAVVARRPLGPTTVTTDPIRFQRPDRRAIEPALIVAQILPADCVLWGA